jgi:hypothetical protein
MRVPIGALRFGIAFVRGVHVELHRQPLRHELLRGEGAHQLDAVLVADLGIGRQCDDDLARHLGVLALLGRLRRIPQHTRFAELLCRTLGQ